MDEAKLILGLHQDEKNFDSCLVLRDTMNKVAPSGSPAISTFNSERGDVVFPFPPVSGHGPRLRIPVHFKNLLIKEDSYYKDLLIEQLDSFSIRKFNEFRERLQKEKVIAFKFDSMDTAIEFLEKSDALRYQFKFNNLFSKCTNNGDPGRKTEYHEAYLTLFDISVAIPIFNSKKMDGTCFNFDIVYVRRSKSNEKISVRASASAVLTNFAENVFIVDGMKINGTNSYGKALIEHLIKTAKEAKQFDKKYKGYGVKEEDVVKEEKKEKKSVRIKSASEYYRGSTANTSFTTTYSTNGWASTSNGLG